MPSVSLFQTLLDYLPVGFGLVLKTMLVGVATHENCFEGRELKVGMRMLTDESHALCQLAGGVVEHILAIKTDLPFLGCEQPSDEP